MTKQVNVARVRQLVWPHEKVVNAPERLDLAPAQRAHKSSSFTRTHTFTRTHAQTCKQQVSGVTRARRVSAKRCRDLPASSSRQARAARRAAARRQTHRIERTNAFDVPFVVLLSARSLRALHVPETPRRRQRVRLFDAIGVGDERAARQIEARQVISCNSSCHM